MNVPTFRRYYNSEFINYQKAVAVICSKFNTTQLKLAAPLGNLVNNTTQLASVFGLDRGSDITDTLVDLDTRRDRALVGIRKNIDSFIDHFEQTKRDAATLLLGAIDKHGTKLSILNYIAETEVIRKIISDISTDTALKAAVTALGLTAWFAELNTANELFNDAFLQRNAEKSDKPTTTTLLERASTEAAYNTLLKHIAANNLLTPNADYDAILKEIDTLTDQFNTVVKKRSKPAKAKEGGEGK